LCKDVLKVVQAATEAGQVQGLGIRAKDARAGVIVVLAAKFVSFVTIMFAKLIIKMPVASCGNTFPIVAKSSLAARREPAPSISVG
jgi:hypothetical protein